MNRLYVQFISRGDLCLGDTTIDIFQNGFSNVWENCRDSGDMVLLRPGDQIPEFDGVVYVSAWYRSDIIEVYRYAKENPNTRIVVGGPIVHIIKDIPKYRLKNVFLTSEPAESIFIAEDHKWGLEIPDIYKNAHVAWTYMVDSSKGCYWGKCKFCRASHGSFKNEFKPIDEVPIIEVGKTKTIWLGSLCMTPKTLSNVYSVIDPREDVYYYSYVRATKASANALVDALKRSGAGKQCVFYCGIEYPGNRMLSLMNKGTTTEEQLYFVQELTKLGCKMCLNFIVDWVNITDQDLDEAEVFFKQLKEIHNYNLYAKLYELHLVPSILADEYRGKVITVSNTLGDRVNCMPVLTRQERLMNIELRHLYYNFPWIHLDESSLNKNRPKSEAVKYDWNEFYTD